jgi:hypothetical protein
MAIQCRFTAGEKDSAPVKGLVRVLQRWHADGLFDLGVKFFAYTHLHAKFWKQRFRHDRPDAGWLQRTNGAAFLLLPEHGQHAATLFLSARPVRFFLSPRVHGISRRLARPRKILSFPR